MKRVIRTSLPTFLCAFLWLVPVKAQEVVIDPSQIAASASNAADQIDFMFDQLGELASLTDKLAWGEEVRG